MSIHEIQALIDKNSTLSREALSPQIHAISDETHLTQSRRRTARYPTSISHP
jgi:hypothetical protein